MTDRERLENMSPIGFDLNGNVLLKSEDYHWLMEQAERVEELEKSHLETKELLYSAISENKRLSEKSIKYRELLSDIANLAYYKEQDEEYYESLLKQVILFARYTLEG